MTAASAIEREEFSDRLKQALRTNEIDASPTGLARRFNINYIGAPITTHAARKWIAAEAIPTQDKLRTLAEMLNVTADWLRFGGDSEPQAARRSTENLASSDVRLITDLNKLDSRDQKLARDFLRLLIARERKATSERSKANV